MRISEIKQIITDSKVLQCVKHDFWEEEYYRNALSSEKCLTDVDSIYTVLKIAYLKLLNRSKQDETQTLYAHGKKIRRLSKLLYGDPLYWACGTEWEDIVSRRNNFKLTQEKYLTIQFLYDRFKLRKRKNNEDIIYLSAQCDAFYDEILKSEDTQDKIETLLDLYSHYEKVALNILTERKLVYLEYRLVRSAAYLASKDADLFLNRNNLTLSQILEESKVSNDI